MDFEKKDPWIDGRTLDEVVISLIEDKKTDSPEFEKLLTYYGREKLLKIWKDRKKEEKK